jgi:predicted transcriptional regulator/transcriptional regulator with XRE-family HTH domain
MQEAPQVGDKVRRLRRQRALPQADLAAAMGISASYLNLIEHNRRRVTVPLLFKLAGYFGLEPGELVESDDAQIAADLMQVFSDELFADDDITNQEIRDLAHSNPVASRAVLRLFDRYRQLVEVRASGADTEPVNATGHPATEAISDFIQENANHFPSLEAAAERIRADIDSTGEGLEAGLKTYLDNVLGIRWQLTSLPHHLARRISNDGRTLEVSDILPAESALFTTAHFLASRLAAVEIDEIIVGSRLPQADAPVLANNVLASYFAAALIMPYEPFLRAARDCRYDVDRLARRFNSSFEQVCHRLTTLQRPGMQGIPLHLVRADIAGNISKRFSLSGLAIPRYGSACPRWNVYSAFLRPGEINVQISQLPDGESYFCIARSITKGDYRHNAPRRHFSIGLGCRIEHARQMVYSDGIDLGNLTQVVPVGAGCRVCPRMDCGQRAHPPADHRFRLDPATRAESIYTRMA